MVYRDEFVDCEVCGQRFVYTVEEQRRQDELGFAPQTPTRCAKCRQRAEPEPGLRSGIVKFFNETKGFGFIIQQDGSEIFFHKTGISGDFASVAHENASVWYELEMSDRGLQATNVMPV